MNVEQLVSEIAGVVGGDDVVSRSVLTAKLEEVADQMRDLERRAKATELLERALSDARKQNRLLIDTHSLIRRKIDDTLGETNRHLAGLVGVEGAVQYLIAQFVEASAEREKFQVAASVLCGAHIGVPQPECPICTRDRLRSLVREFETEGFVVVSGEERRLVYGEGGQ